jgi:hypothetical protein
VTTEPAADKDNEGAISADGETNSEPQPDPSVEALRDILFSQYRERIADLENEMRNLERRLTNPEILVSIIAPVLGDAIRRKIRDARDEMIEALYPVIGQTVMRAVQEAFRDLARTIDAQMRRSLDMQTMSRRIQARVSGVSSADMVLRESLPFDVAEVFLIHRETGLLLWHISRDPNASSDSDLISGMLTAIRDFVQESFGQGKEGQLDEIQYGERRILIETGQYAYLAVVVEGTEPPGYRAEIRERVIEVSHTYEPTLRKYDGDPTPLAPVEPTLQSLITGLKPAELTTTQKRVLAGTAALLTVCLIGTCLTGTWIWQTVRATPIPVVIVVPTATPTLTATPSPTPTFTPSPTNTPTHTPTFTPSPTNTSTQTPTSTPTTTSTPTPSPFIGLMTGNVWLREGPSLQSPRLGIILERNQLVEILAVSNNWYRVRWAPPQAEAEVIGWAPAQWIGTTDPIPDQIITPTP